MTESDPIKELNLIFNVSLLILKTVVFVLYSFCTWLHKFRRNCSLKLHPLPPQQRWQQRQKAEGRSLRNRKTTLFSLCRT
jgi:hypothetical protein